MMVAWKADSWATGSGKKKGACRAVEKSEPWLVVTMAAYSVEHSAI